MTGQKDRWIAALQLFSSTTKATLIYVFFAFYHKFFKLINQITLLSEYDLTFTLIDGESHQFIDVLISKLCY